MKILVNLYYPFFDSHLAGGVQITMRTILEACAKKGVFFTVLCPENKKFPYANIKGIEVHPVLKNVFDNSNPTNSIYNYKIIKSMSQNHDMLWSIDRSIPFPLDIPIVLSSNAICYPKELDAIVGMNWSCIISSIYAMKTIESWFGDDYWKKVNAPMKMGIDCPLKRSFVKSKVSYELRNLLSIKSNKKYVLFPHRPDEGKGHYLAVDVLKELILMDRNFQMLIPTPPTSLEKDIQLEKEFIEKIKNYAKKLGVKNNITFHKWLSEDILSEYYSLGYCTLILSSLPETFCMSLVQSISCQTPVISTGAGAMREIVPQNMGHILVDNLNAKQIAATIYNANSFRKVLKGSKFVQDRYDINKTTSNYVSIFRKVIKYKS